MQRVLDGVLAALLLSMTPATADTTYHHRHLVASSVGVRVISPSRYDAAPFASALAPTEGRAIDRLSWEAQDLDAVAAAMKERGVTFREGPHADLPD